MITTYIIIATLGLAIWILLRRINRKYFILSLTRRVQTQDGSPLGTKVFVQPGKTMFGNNLDLLLMTPRKLSILSKIKLLLSSYTISLQILCSNTCERHMPGLKGRAIYSISYWDQCIMWYVLRMPKKYFKAPN